MMDTRGTGVFGSVGETAQNSADAITLELAPADPEKHDSIYDLIFKDYDEEQDK